MRPEAVLNEQQRAGRFGDGGGGGGRRRKRTQDPNSDMDSPSETSGSHVDEQLTKILAPKVGRIVQDFGAAARLNEPESADKLWEKLDEVFGRRNENLVAGRKEFWSNVAKLSSEFRQFAALQR